MQSSELKGKINKIIAMFDKDAVLYLIIILLITGFGIMKLIMPQVPKITKNIKSLTDKQKMVKMLETRLKFQQQDIKQEAISNIPVEIYESFARDVSLESATIEVTNEVINIIKENGNNIVKSLDFEEKDLEDASGSKSSNHSALRLNLQLQTSYENIQSVLNEIYSMEYLIRLQEVSVIANRNDSPHNVKANLVLDIYVRTS